VFDDINFTTERTRTGCRIKVTATVNPRVMEGVERWALREAEVGRLFSITNLEPGEFGNGVVMAQRINYKPDA
jgi:hypothetical protein